MSDIANKTLSTTVWATVEKIGTMGIQFVISMVLARLLDPEAYGIIAMLTIFIALANQFVECGFSNALIRKPSCTQIDYSTAFFFNIIVGIIAYFILFNISPLVSSFYEMPSLSLILRVNGLILLTNSCLIVPNAILTRDLAFKKMAKYNILTNAFSGTIAIVLAYEGLGVWTLVFQSLVGSILVTLFLWHVSHWKPIMAFSKDSLNYLWGFGSKMLVSGLISTVYANIYSLVIGKIYSAKELGYFNKGQSIALLLPNIVNSTFGKSTLPLLSKVQDDRERLTHVYRQFAILVSFIGFPMVVFIFVLAKPFVLFFLTEKWAESIIYVKIFAISAMTGPVGMVNLNLLQAAGRSDYTLKAEVIKKGIGFVVVAILCSFSPLVLAYGSMILNIFIYCVNLYYARKVIGLRFSVQITDLLPYLYASCFTGICVWASIYFIQNNFVQLFVGSVVGCIIYYVITRYAMKVEFYNYFFSIAASKLTPPQK